MGDEAAIRKIAAELSIDLSGYEIINEPDKVKASLTAVKWPTTRGQYVHEGPAADTKTFLKSVLDKEVACAPQDPVPCGRV